MNAKLKATATVAVSHTAHSKAVLPDSVGGTLRVAGPADTEIEHYPVKFRADKNTAQALHAGVGSAAKRDVDKGNAIQSQRFLSEIADASPVEPFCCIHVSAANKRRSARSRSAILADNRLVAAALE